MKLKVCGLKHPDNIRGVVDLQPDFIGLIFYTQSPRYVGEQFQFPETDHSVEKVGVFVKASEEEIIHKVRLNDLDYVQLHGGESVALCRALRDRGIKVIKVFAVDQQLPLAEIKEFEGATDYFLFDTKTAAYGGSGKQFDWSILRAYPSEVPFILSGGISHSDIGNIMKMDLKQLAAIDVNSGVETEPGKKDLQQVARVITTIHGGTNEEDI